MSEEELPVRLEKFVLKLHDRHKLTRKDGLMEYYRLLFEDINDSSNDSIDYTAQLNQNIVILTNLLSDESEINRIKVSEIIIAYIRQNAMKENHLIYFITAIHNRITKKTEESEDVKGNLVLIINLIINQFGGALSGNSQDLAAIQLSLLSEKSPDLLIATCNCITAFTEMLKRKAACHSLHFIEPLAAVSFHQRYKVRKAAIQAIGSLGIWGDSSQIAEVSMCLAQHASDIPYVRLSIIDVAVRLALYMPDRYTYWIYILPCILPWLRDRDEQTRNTAVKSYTAVGQQYLKENYQRLETQINYDSMPQRYPDTGIPRLNVGCRVLAQSVLHPLLPGISGDLQDWESGSRLATCRLLTTLILLAESQVQQHAPRLLQLLHFAITDTEQDVVKEAFICAEWLGFFMLPEACLPSCLHLLANPCFAVSEDSYGNTSNQLRCVKLVQLVTKGLTTYHMAPYLHQLVNALHQLASLIATNIQLQNDVLDIVEQMLLKWKDAIVIDNKTNEAGSPIDTVSSGNSVTASIGSRNLEVKYLNHSSKDLPDDASLSNNTSRTDLASSASFEDEQTESVKSFDSGNVSNSTFSSRIPDSETALATLNINSKSHCSLSNQNSSNSSGSSPTNSSASNSSVPTNHPCVSVSASVLRLLLLVRGSELCKYNTARAVQLMTLLVKDGESDNEDLVQVVLRDHASRVMPLLLHEAPIWSPPLHNFLTASAFLTISVRSLGEAELDQLVALYQLVFTVNTRHSGSGSYGHDSLVLARLLALLTTHLSTQGGSLVSSPRYRLHLARILKGWLGPLLTEKRATVNTSGEVSVLRSGAVQLLATACDTLHSVDDPPVLPTIATPHTAETGTAASPHEPSPSKCPSCQWNCSPSPEQQCREYGAVVNSNESGETPAADALQASDEGRVHLSQRPVLTRGGAVTPSRASSQPLQHNLAEALSSMTPHLQQLVSDEEVHTRYYALHLVLHISRLIRVPPHFRVQLLQAATGLLDDRKSVVRRLAAGLAGPLVRNLLWSPGAASPAGTEVDAALLQGVSAILARLLLFLDDPDARQRHSVRESVLLLVPLVPQLLQQHLQQLLPRARNQQLITELLDSLHQQLGRPHLLAL